MLWILLNLAIAKKVDSVICDSPCTISATHDMVIRDTKYVLAKVARATTDELWLVKQVGRIQASEWLMTLPPTATYTIGDGTITVTTPAGTSVVQLAPVSLLSTQVAWSDPRLTEKLSWSWSPEGGLLKGIRCDGSDAPSIPYTSEGTGPIGDCGHIYTGPAGPLKVVLRGAKLAVQTDHYGSLLVDVGVGCGDTEPLDIAVQAGEVVYVDIPEGLSVRGLSFSHQGDHPMAEDAPQVVTHTGTRARTLEAPQLSAYQCVEGEPVWNDPHGPRMGNLTRK